MATRAGGHYSTTTVNRERVAESGMYIDIGNALDGDLGLTREELEKLDERVSSAHDRISRGREEREHGYAALALPETCDPETIRTTVAEFDDVGSVVTIGIGGSALGAATITAALGAEVQTVFLDNVDPDWITGMLNQVELSRAVINVVSRSGATAETLANFLVVREACDKAGIDWTDRTLVTTGPEGNLRRLAEKHDLPVLDVPEGVPGRFAALSTVGLACAALQDHSLEALLAGAADEADRLTGSLFESPAYAYGAITYALAERGAAANVMMPYAESLERFAEWFAQLWAESLGKAGRGQTPVRALGATDQHSQLQLYRAGPADKLVTFVRPREHDGPEAEARPDGSGRNTDRTIPETELDGLAYLGGSSLEQLLDAEFRATEASLAATGRESVRIEVERVDERGLGELLYGMEAACILHGELADVETFTQPAVEWAKRATRGLLGGGEFEEAAAVRGKRRLEIG